MLKLDLPEGLVWGKRENIKLKSLFSHEVLEFINQSILVCSSVLSLLVMFDSLQSHGL